MKISLPSFQRFPAALAIIATAGLFLLCGAGSTPVENLVIQGPLQADLNLSGHNLSNAQIVSSASLNTSTLNVSGSATLPGATTVNGATIGSVSNFTAGNLSPLFTTATATPASTPALAFALSSAAQNSFFAGPSTGGAGAPGYRPLTAADIPGLAYDPSGAATTAQTASLQKASNLSDLTNTATARTNLGLGSAATQALAAFTPATTGSSLLAGNGSGGTTNVTLGSGLTLNSGTLSATATGSGSGTVTTLSAGNLSPLFTTSIATPTTTPAVTFGLSNAAQNSVLAGPASGGAGVPSYQVAPTISGANLTALPTTTSLYPTLNQNTTGSAAAAASFTGSLGGDVTGTQGATTVGKINGTALSSLATGLLKNTTSTGVPTIAVAGTDYAPATTGTSLLAGNGSGGTTNVSLGSGLTLSSGTLSATASGTGSGLDFRNRIINGDFVINQRGNTANLSPSLTYFADRWYADAAGGTPTQVVNAYGTPFRYGWNFTGATGTTSLSFGQRIESSNVVDLVGNAVTLSAFLASSTLTTVTWTAYYATGSLNNFSGEYAFATGTFALTSSLTQSQATFTVPLTSNAKNGLDIVFTATNFTSGTLSVTRVQLELGTAATTFEQLPVSVQLSLCQRYYQTQYLNARFTATAAGQYGEGAINFPVTMLKAPFATLISGTPTNATTSFAFLNASSACLNLISAAAGDCSFLNLLYGFTAEL